MGRVLTKKPKQTSPADGFLGTLFGMAVAGMVLGPGAASALQSFDTVASFHQDRQKPRMKKPAPVNLTNAFGASVFGMMPAKNFAPVPSSRRMAAAHRF